MGNQNLPRIDEIRVDSSLEAIGRLSVDVIKTQFSLAVDVFAHIVKTTLRRLRYTKHENPQGACVSLIECVSECVRQRMCVSACVCRRLWLSICEYEWEIKRVHVCAFVSVCPCVFMCAYVFMCACVCVRKRVCGFIF